MQLYPHWLDGEFVKITSGATGPNQDVRDSIRALKLHALLGTQFILNDVQIFDSAAVVALFGDAKAREFLSQDRSFLDLRVEPDAGLGETALALAGRGLTRTRAEGWLSSMFVADPTPMKRLADEIIDDIQRRGSCDPESSRVVQRYPEYQELLRAIRHAVHHFGTIDAATALVAPSGKRTNYYEVLCKLRERTLAPEDEVLLGQTLAFIEREISDPEARKARSVVWRALDRAGTLTNLERESIRNTVVQAWNYATQQTLDPHGGSVGVLPHAVSPAPYFDSVTDILVPIRKGDWDGRTVVSRDCSMLPCEIDDIGWDDIHRVRDGTPLTMERLRHARYSGSMEAVSEPLREHLGAVGKILRPRREPSACAYAVKVGGVVVALLGAPKAWESWIAAGLQSIEVAKDIRGDIGAWRERRALTDTLFAAATGLRR